MSTKSNGVFINLGGNQTRSHGGGAQEQSGVGKAADEIRQQRYIARRTTDMNDRAKMTQALYRERSMALRAGKRVNTLPEVHDNMSHEDMYAVAQQMNRIMGRKADYDIFSEHPDAAQGPTQDGATVDAAAASAPMQGPTRTGATLDTTRPAAPLLSRDTVKRAKGYVPATVESQVTDTGASAFNYRGERNVQQPYKGEHPTFDGTGSVPAGGPAVEVNPLADRTMTYLNPNGSIAIAGNDKAQPSPATKGLLPANALRGVMIDPKYQPTTAAAPGDIVGSGKAPVLPGIGYTTRGPAIPNQAPQAPAAAPAPAVAPQVPAQAVPAAPVPQAPAPSASPADFKRDDNSAVADVQRGQLTDMRKADNPLTNQMYDAMQPHPGLPPSAVQPAPDIPGAVGSAVVNWADRNAPAPGSDALTTPGWQLIAGGISRLGRTDAPAPAPSAPASAPTSAIATGPMQGPPMPVGPMQGPPMPPPPTGAASITQLVQPSIKPAAPPEEEEEAQGGVFGTNGAMHRAFSSLGLAKFPAKGSDGQPIAPLWGGPKSAPAQAAPVAPAPVAAPAAPQTQDQRVTALNSDLDRLHKQAVSNKRDQEPSTQQYAKFTLGF